MFWKLVGVILSCFGSLLSRCFVFWGLVGVNFHVLGACKVHFLGLRGFVCLLGAEDTFKRPTWEHFSAFWCPFGRHLGAILVLCCNFLEIFLGCQIHPYLEGVSEAILGDLATS